MLAQFAIFVASGDLRYMDIIFINQLELQTIIGIHDWERQATQPIILDIEIACSTITAAQTDDIADCIDYFSVSERMKQLAAEHNFQLVESWVEEASRIILYEFGAQQVKIKLSKPNAVPEAQGVGVIIERQRTELNN